jgi:N-acetylglucosaminyldiphosphoundecaprenol N-acetyl-beta-D-mannosaminyltransferase
VLRLEQTYPGLIIAGHYSPPFNPLLEMDHEEIKRRIAAAKPDVLFVSFGCPKQEKWVAMHYRNLAVPVTAGVGATIDFLAGQVKRAPLWMQRSGTEWMFRLAQEPRRLFRRYVTDLWGFGAGIFPQWWQLQARGRRRRPRVGALPPPTTVAPTAHSWFHARLPDRLDFAAVNEQSDLVREMAERGEDCLLEMASTAFIDSTGIGLLIGLQKSLRSRSRHLVLLAPSSAVLRAVDLMRLTDFFHMAPDEQLAITLLESLREESLLSAGLPQLSSASLSWSGEITAANAESVWALTEQYLRTFMAGRKKTIDLSHVRFIDSTGLGLMVRAKKMSLASGEDLVFAGLRPSVRNVLRLARLEDFLLDSAAPGLLLHRSHPQP